MLIKLRAALFTAALLTSVWAASAQDKNIPKDLYQASTIAADLKQDAHAVVRYATTDVTVTAPGHATLKHHSLVTILDDKGDDNAELVLGYDKKFRSIHGMQMMAYSADGKLIKKYSKSDAYDHSATDGFSIITDDRWLGLRHSIGTYPVTIEKVFELELNSYLDLPQWRIQGKETAVQNEDYKISVVPSLGFRYKNYNTTITPQKQTANGLDVYTWHVSNLKAVTPEEDVPDWKFTPCIRFATNSFSFYNIPGDFSSWQNYGKWQLDVNKDVCNLSPQRVAEIKQMTANLKTDKEKAAFLYRYMQQNMRYVSIQLGIGGLKPFPASFVDEKKYGDCKALTNYMYALLKAVNIPSYYAIINAGTNAEPADDNFPADPFNHVILCIPFKNDTTWLECTSNKMPFGVLGNFTEDRKALLITETGGKLVNTPKSTAAANQFNSYVQIKLEEDGGATAQLKFLSTGGYRELFVDHLPTISEDKQKEYLIRAFKFKQPYAFNYKSLGDSAGTKEVAIDLDYDNFCDIAAGSKKFYRPRVFDLWGLTLPVVEKRVNDYYFDHPMQKSCVTTIQLPPGYEAESLPENTQLKFSYGNYDATYKYDAAKNQVTSTVKFNMNSHVIPAAKYNEMQQYMDNIAKAQSKKLIIRKKA